MNLLYILALIGITAQTILLSLIFIQIRGFLIDFYANANQTGVEIPKEEYEGSDYLNDETDLATILNQLGLFKNQSAEASKAKENSESQEEFKQPPSFFDLFQSGVEIPDDEYSNDVESGD